jgi:hypothetical protein
MPKFISSHTMPAGALRREQVNQLAQAARKEPTGPAVTS